MADIVVTAGLQDVVKTNDIALNIGIGIGDRIPHTSLSGKVYDNIYRVVAKQPVNDSLVGNGVVDECPVASEFFNFP